MATVEDAGETREAACDEEVDEIYDWRNENSNSER